MLTEGQRQIRDMAPPFARARAGADRCRTRSHAALPARGVQRMGEHGTLGMMVPAEFGGAGTDYVLRWR